MTYYFVTKEPTLIVTISGEFSGQQLQSVPAPQQKSCSHQKGVSWEQL